MTASAASKQISDIRPAPPISPNPPSAQKRKHRRMRYGLIVIIAFLLLATGGFFIMRRDTPSPQTEAAAVQQSVGRHVLLPKDEEPAIATVTDKSKLQSEFLKQAENNDKILIYQKAKLVIIYRPSIDKIVNIGPVSMSSPSE